MSDRKQLYHSLRADFDGIKVKDLSNFFHNNNVPEDAEFSFEWENGLVLEWHAMETDDEYKRRVEKEKKVEKGREAQDIMDYKRLKLKFEGPTS